VNSTLSGQYVNESVSRELREYLGEEHTVFAGRYRLVRALAKVTSGGCVWAAEHVRTRRTCALKILAKDASERVRHRAAREMDALARAQGPGIVEFRDGGEIDGRIYIALELFEGRTLSGLLAAKGKLSVEQTVKLGIEMADALAHCHERGVVHRDIKPANIFVTTENSAQLIDFGIAKLIDEEQVIEKLTQENTLLGTPEYMAPEALFMAPNVDHTVDQYALAVTLYECLTGVVPFPGTLREVLAKVSMTTTAPPLKDLPKDVPVALAQVLTRALSREAEHRFASVAEMRDAIRASQRVSVDDNVFALRAPKPERNPPTTADTPVAKQKPAEVTRRRHARAPYVTLALINGETITVEGRIEEISESGFQFVSERELPSTGTFAVRFARPVSGRISEAVAALRWRRAARGMCAAGFEFTTLPSDALGEIQTYVSIMCAD